MWKVNEDGISITDPNGKVYVAGDEITRSDGTIIMVKSDYEGITEEDLRKYVPDARSWNGVIVASLNIKGADATQEQVDQAIENATTLSLNADDFIIEDDVKVNWSQANAEQAFQKNEVGRWAYQGDDFLIMHGQQISSLATPTAAMDAANKQYVDTEIGGQEFKTINGETINGPGNIVVGEGTIPFDVNEDGNIFTQKAFSQIIIGGGNRFFITGRDIESGDAPNTVVNKQYVDDQTFWRLQYTGVDYYLTPITRDDINGVTIDELDTTNLFARVLSVSQNLYLQFQPTDDRHATRKDYVDNQITSTNEYTDSSIQLMTDFFQAQITQIHDAVYSQYMAFDINSNQRWTFTDYDDSYWYMFYLTVRLTGNRLVTGILEIPARTVAGTEVCNVISDTTSGSSNNLRFLNRQVWVDNWQGDPIYVTTIRIMRRKELVA